MIERIALFGATGDLTGRFLLPALAQLAEAGQFPDNFAVLGAAQPDWDEATFRQHAHDQLARHSAEVPVGVRNELVERLGYQQVDVTQHESVGAIIDALTGADRAAPLVAYLALPTGLLEPAITALGTTGLPSGSRVAVEKPFGKDVDSARSLNALLATQLGEQWEHAVFRVDHALGMVTMQNLLPLRFANRTIGALWSGEHVAEIEVLWEETLALEGRAAYYDHAGALEDVVQNHMMQLFCMAAMEAPDGWSVNSFPVAELRRRKVEVLRSVRELSSEEVIATSRRARYTAGRLADTGGADGRQVVDYTAEDGVDPDRNTETFAEVVVTVDQPRWQGTRFRLRAGKALAERRKGLLVRFRPVAATDGRPAAGERLWIGIDGPNNLALHLTALGADDAPGPASLALTGPQPTSTLSPYAHVLRDLLQGKSALSVGSEEAEHAWRILAPVRRAWDSGLVPMREYPAGSPGLPT